MIKMIKKIIKKVFSKDATDIERPKDSFFDTLKKQKDIDDFDIDAVKLLHNHAIEAYKTSFNQAEIIENKTNRFFLLYFITLLFTTYINKKFHFINFLPILFYCFQVARPNKLMSIAINSTEQKFVNLIKRSYKELLLSGINTYLNFSIPSAEKNIKQKERDKRILTILISIALLAIFSQQIVKGLEYIVYLLEEHIVYLSERNL